MTSLPIQATTSGIPAAAPPTGAARSPSEALLPTRLFQVKPPEPEEKPAEASGEKKLRQSQEAAQRANAYLQLADTDLQFVVAEHTGRIVVKVIDSATHEVIRQIPPENLNRFADQFTEMKGLLFETKG